MPIVVIRSDNFNGQVADVTFIPATGGTEVYFYGVTIPYQYQTEYPYGSYSIHFTESNNTCPVDIFEVTPTPTSSAPCRRGCCYVELCSGADCAEACSCNFQAGFYLSIPCETDPCTLANALGIYTDDTCTNPARAGSYSDGFGCWDWDGSSTLTFNSNC